MPAPTPYLWDSTLANTGPIPSGLLNAGYALNAIPTSTVFNTLWNNVTQRLINIESAGNSGGGFPNSNFMVWQNGPTITIPASGAKQTADRRVFGAASVPCTVSAIKVNSSPDLSPYYCGSDTGMLIQTPGGGVGNEYHYLCLKNVASYNGQNATYSAGVFNNTGAPVVLQTPYWRQYFGSGGTPHAQVDTPCAQGDITIPVGYSVIVANFAVPSIAGLGIGTDGKDCARVTLPMLSSQAKTLAFLYEKVEPGLIATPYVSNSFGDELSACQAFLEKSYELSTAPGTPSGVDITVESSPGAVVFYSKLFAASVPVSQDLSAYPLITNLNTRFKVNKVIAPTVIWYSAAGTPNAITATDWFPTTGQDVAATAKSPSTTETGFIEVSGAPNIGSIVYGGYWVADCGIL